MCGNEGRGPNKPVYLKVAYRSGRVEVIEYHSKKTAEKVQFKLAKFPTIKRVYMVDRPKNWPRKLEKTHDR